MKYLAKHYRARLLACSIAIFSCLISNSALAQTDFHGDILLGRPTDQSIAVSVMSFRDTQVYVEYGDASGSYASNTETQPIAAEDIHAFELEDLDSNAEYFYRVRYKTNTSQSEPDYAATEEYSFNTAKSPGSSFNFAVQADPHLGARTRFEKWCGPRCTREAADDKTYSATVENMLRYDPDFLVDLGDFFMTAQSWGNGLFPVQNRVEDAPITQQDVIEDVTYVRSLMTKGGSSIPMFLVQGNHEAEDGGKLDGTPDNMAVWSINARKKYFPSPTDNHFYSGPTTEYEFIGRQDGYYSWEWGDALFVALDPFWAINRCEVNGPWCDSIGKEQFDWLKNTLEESDAKFKFVFLHYLIGGLDNPYGGNRGGALYSDYFEWGGRTPFDVENWNPENYEAYEAQVQDADGGPPKIRRVDSSTESYDFEKYRPGWGGKSIQDILLENGVQIVFHGHDHIYVREQHANGIYYHEVPQPSRETPGGQGLLVAAGNQGYDYEEGVVVEGTGFVNVSVSSDEVTVEYVRNKKGCTSAPCAEIADSYSIPAE